MNTFNNVSALLLIMLLISGCHSNKKEESIQRIPDYTLKYISGMQNLQNGNPKQAVKLFEESLQINPYSCNVYILAAKIYIQIKNYPDMIRLLSSGLDKCPNDGNLPLLLAVALKETGQLKESFLAAQRSAEIFDAWQNNEDIKRAQLFMLYISQELKKTQ